MKFWLTICFLAIIFSSCKNNKDLTIGEELFDSQSNIIVNDTSTIRMFTFKTDSVITSGVYQTFVGRNTDGEFGTLTASSFFSLGIPGVTLNDEAVYDSAAMYFERINYYTGDTTKPFTLEIHQLTQRIDKDIPDNGYRYNLDSMNYTATPLGSRTFIPMPQRKQHVNVRLDEPFGQTMFDLVKTNDDNVKDNATFIQYFNGIAITASAQTKSAIIGFAAVDTSISMRIYYHVNDVSYYFDYQINNTNLQFNHIRSNLSATSLSSLTNRDIRLSSRLSSNSTFCQSGSGIMTRLELPYLKNLRINSQKIKVLKAELLLYPKKGSYTVDNLPSQLAMYKALDDNTAGGLANDTTVSSLTVDYSYGEETKYTYDITTYVNQILADQSDDYLSLIIAPTVTSYFTTFRRVVLSDGLLNTNSTRLKLTYWSY